MELRAFTRRLPPGAKRVLRALRRRRQAIGQPLLSVVVPVHDAELTLERCVESLVVQSWPRKEILLVVHEQDAASLALATEVARGRRAVRVVRGGTGSVGSARNAGERAAKGAYLAFCDADDSVPPVAYQRLLQSLEASDSDVVVGGLTVEERGRLLRPAWLSSTNPGVRRGATGADVPDVLAHPYLGARLFRRSSWRRAGLRFAEGTAFPDHVLLAQVALAPWRVDVLPSTVYHARLRHDRGSMTQRSLRDTDLAMDRLDRLREAVALLDGRPDARRALLRGALITVVADLVRYALVYGPPSWDRVSPAVSALLADADDDTWADVPVVERMLAWLCAHEDMETTGAFQAYAHANRTGLHYELVDGVPVVRPDELAVLGPHPEHLLEISRHELRYRTRLEALRWESDTSLTIRGTAFTEYLTAADPGAVTRVVLEDEVTGERWPLPTEPHTDETANLWAGRAHEDLASAGFVATVDLDALPPRHGPERVYRVLVEHETAGSSWVAGLQSRLLEGSAGQLHTGGVDGAVLRFTWEAHEGLQVRHSGGRLDRRRREIDPNALATVLDLEVRDDAVVLTLDAPSPVELALRSPRAHLDWVSAERGHDGVVRARLPLRSDEWGQGATELPQDRYVVDVRPVGNPRRTVTISSSLSLWQRMPVRLTVGTSTVIPEVTVGRGFRMRVQPAEWRTDQSANARATLREVDYPRMRELPLLDVAMFETFGGRAGGDQPGPLAEELHRRHPDLDLAFVVVDRSVQVPACARKVVRLSREHLELLARARYLVVNSNQPPFFVRREGQAVVQTWHGSPLKRIGHDRIHNDIDNWYHRRNLVEAVKQWDFLVAQSPFCSERLREAFHFTGTMLDVGYPRNDVLHSPDRAERAAEVRRRLGIAADVPVVLYAPTWRETRRTGAVYDKVLYLDPPTVARELDAVVLVRGHYHSIQAAEKRDPDRRVIDVTRYPDIADLYLAADAMVTDYSSAFFDFAATDKPMAFLAPDLAEYRDDNRGFYLDYHETVPGPECQSTAEVVEVLRTALADPSYDAERRARFRETYAPWDDGGASARVVDALLEAFPRL